MQITDLVLDDRAHQVTRAGREVVLPLTEYRILRYLLQGRGQALSKAQIIEAGRAGISLIGQASPDVTRS
ncbi:hypothetical protein [Streptomyces aureus]|uniref:hypothetical protein n=1 Tax=Streptomyces aureus TaxID=193461 RepID=UPI003699AF3D